MTFHLQHDESVGAGLCRVAHEQIGIVLAECSSGELPLEEQVHMIRARCKKMRALLRLVQPAMGDAFAAEDQRFREVGKELGQYRDNDVFLKAIQSLGGNVPARAAPEIGSASDAVRRSLGSMAAARDAIDRWPVHDTCFADIASGFALTYRDYLESWRQAQQDPTDENFHAWRKQTKHHWYQVRILERINKPELRKRRLPLWELQRTLGNAHDLVLLEEMVNASGKTDEPLLRRAGDRKRQLYDKARSLGKELCSTAEQALAADLTEWWHAWRQ